MTGILSHLVFPAPLFKSKHPTCINFHMVGLTLRRDASFWPRDLSACSKCQQEHQISQISQIHLILPFKFWASNHHSYNFWSNSERDSPETSMRPRCCGSRGWHVGPIKRQSIGKYSALVWKKITREMQKKQYLFIVKRISIYLYYS